MKFVVLEPLANECSLKIWMEDTSPLPPLQLAGVLLAAWDAAAAEIQAADEAICARMAEFVAILANPDDKPWEPGR
jgi:hypothetical protein